MGLLIFLFFPVPTQMISMTSLLTLIAKLFVIDISIHSIKACLGAVRYFSDLLDTL